MEWSLLRRSGLDAHRSTRGRVVVSRAGVDSGIGGLCLVVAGRR